MVVGATARNLLLYHVYGIPATRATRDVDFAIAVENCEKFETLRAALFATSEFVPGPMEQHLFFRTSQGTTDIPIDLIPFGGVAEEDTVMAAETRHGDDHCGI
jgi:predicted nucleotidyltransferase